MRKITYSVLSVIFLSTSLCSHAEAFFNKHLKTEIAALKSELKTKRETYQRERNKATETIKELKKSNRTITEKITS